MFQYKSEILVNHSIVYLLRRHTSVVTFQSTKPALSRLDRSRPRLSFAGFPSVDFPVSKFEKNWVYFQHQDNLFLLYSFNPYRILKLKNRDTLEFETVIHRTLSASVRDLGGFGTIVSLSTNPVDYDERHWFLLVHQVKRAYSQRFYHYWGVLLDKATMLPSEITHEPLFSGNGARGRMPGILYISSIVRRGNEFIFLAGEGDAYVTRMSLDRKSIESSLTPLSVS